MAETAGRRQARLVAWLASHDGPPVATSALAEALGTTPAALASDLATVTPAVFGLYEDGQGRVGVDLATLRADMREAMASCRRR